MIPLTTHHPRITEVLDTIFAERLRQEQLLASGKFLWTCADRHQSNARKLAVLAEEFGEAAREVTEQIIAEDKGQPTAEIVARLRTELIQVAAVCCAWVEGLDTMKEGTE